MEEQLKLRQVREQLESNLKNTELNQYLEQMKSNPKDIWKILSQMAEDDDPIVKYFALTIGALVISKLLSKK